MQTLQSGYRGLNLLMHMNWHFALYGGVLALGLWCGLWLNAL